METGERSSVEENEELISPFSFLQVRRLIEVNPSRQFSLRTAPAAGGFEIREVAFGFP